MTGVRAYRLRARVRRLVSRLRRPMFVFVIGHHLAWPPPRREVALRFFVRGEPLGSIARSLNASLYRVRQEADAVRVLAAAAGES